MRFGQRPKAVLKSLTLAQVDQLRAAGTVRSYRKNESVYELGEPVKALHVVLRGRARLRDTDWEGRDITVSFAAEGEAFGLEALAGLRRRVLSATAAESSELLSVDTVAVRDLLDRDSALARHLLKHAAQVMTHMEERIKMLAFLDVPSRLAGTILWLADRYGVSVDGGVEVPYWFTHQEMADLIGSTRETVTTVLAEFKRDRLLDSRNHHFVVLDRRALTERIRLPEFGEAIEEQA
ncbi:MAG: Crp/Fnr family transcriptional regulator [Gemmatimonadota bacterium]|nr:MAG: Crp/Fnr family transcriptional regulator [Gemmatimonadota bacterium]